MEINKKRYFEVNRSQKNSEIRIKIYQKNEIKKNFSQIFEFIQTHLVM